MSVLVIRAHKRFAVCRKARLRKPGRRFEDALLIELSLDGCRLSKLGPHAFTLDQTVMLRIDGALDPLEGRIRWLGADGMVGLRFLRPLQAAALDRLIRCCRGEAEALPAPSYGT